MAWFLSANNRVFKTETKTVPFMQNHKIDFKASVPDGTIYHIPPKISIPPKMACFMAILIKTMRTLASIICKKNVAYFRRNTVIMTKDLQKVLNINSVT